MARTDKQRKAIEVYCRLLSEAFSDAGLTMDVVLTQAPVKCDCTQERVKEFWKDIQKAMFNKTSTTELDPREVSPVYEEINRFTAETFGISVEFPDNNRIPMSAYERGRING